MQGDYIHERKGTADGDDGETFGVMNDDATDDEHMTGGKHMNCPSEHGGWVGMKESGGSGK